MLHIRDHGSISINKGGITAGAVAQEILSAHKIEQPVHGHGATGNGARITAGTSRHGNRRIPAIAALGIVQGSCSNARVV